MNVTGRSRPVGQSNSPFAKSLLRDLREANEKLLVASNESKKMKDRAEVAQAAAEGAARALQESKRELLANAELREQFLGIVGHDLRSPLSAIGLSVRLMENQGNLNDEDTRRAGIIKKCVHRMDRMIAHVLDFTRLRSGRGLAIETGPADLRAVCEQAIAELALRPGVQIHSAFDGDLTGSWDGERMIQVFSNLLGNAVDHATPETSIRLQARGSATEVVVEISNQGPPIPADLLPVIFAPFRQGRQGWDATKGHLGLGLYIAREIVGLHQGTLVCQSTDGTTTFTLCLLRFPTAS